MHQKEVMKLALKVSGIYVLVTAIMYIPAIVATFGMLNQENASNISNYTIFIMFIFLVALGLFLVFIKVPKAENSDKTVIDFMPAGLAVAGVIIFAMAISQTPVLVSRLVEFYSSTNPVKFIGFTTPAENITGLIGNVIQLIIGVLFFFKAKYFAKLVK